MVSIWIAWSVGFFRILFSDTVLFSAADGLLTLKETLMIPVITMVGLGVCHYTCMSSGGEGFRFISGDLELFWSLQGLYLGEWFKFCQDRWDGRCFLSSISVSMRPTLIWLIWTAKQDENYSEWIGFRLLFLFISVLHRDRHSGLIAGS